MSTQETKIEPDDDPRLRGDIVEGEDDDKTEDKIEAKTEDKIEDEPEGKADDKGEDGEGEKPPEKRVQMIPKQRFDEARRKDKERIRALEDQLAGKEKDTPKPPSPAERVTALEKESATLLESYAKALDDGETKKAAGFMSQIREIDRKITRIESATASAIDRAAAVEQVRFDMLVEQLQEKYPQLDPNSDDYDEDLTGEIVELRAAFEARGQASSDALKKAVKYVLRDEGPKAKVARDVDKAIEKADEAADDAEDKAAKAKKIAEERKSEAVRRNLKVAGAQPGDTSKAPGLDSHKAGSQNKELPKLEGLSDKEYDALPEAVLKRLRGDYYSAA